MARIKKIEINGLEIAYQAFGSGKTLLFIHGFGSASFCWERLITEMPKVYRFVGIDLKGFGASEKEHEKMSLFDQAAVVSAFITKLDLTDIVLVGHSSGGATALISLFEKDISDRVDKLVLINSVGYFDQIPRFIEQTRIAFFSKKLLERNFYNQLWVKSALHQSFYDHSKLTPEIIAPYTEMLGNYETKLSIMESAKQMAVGNMGHFVDSVRGLKTKTLILWGENDTIVSAEESKRFNEDLENSEVVLIPECGHCPQQEKPKETAEALINFIEGENAASLKVENPVKSRKMKMRRLIDSFDVGVLLIIGFMKFLQFIRKISFKVEAKGWRHLSGIFLRSDHSKFVLTAFRLDYLNRSQFPEVSDGINLVTAKEKVIKRLMEFLRRSPKLHWQITFKGMYAYPEKVFFTDLVEATYDDEGNILELIPHFDDSRDSFPHLDEELKEFLIKRIIRSANETKHLPDPKRYRKMAGKVKKYQRQIKKVSIATRQEIRYFCRRISAATFINFQKLSSNKNYGKERIASPLFTQQRHPGSGLMNIHCRFSADLCEADLWCQFHHVPVDGSPMQIELESLGKEWGKCGKLLFPNDNSIELLPIKSGSKTFYQGRFFVDFSKVVQARRELNHYHLANMGGPAAIASLLSWGLTQHNCLKDQKFAFPVDLSDISRGDESELTLMFIKPQKYFDKKNKRDAFYRFQREFNQRLFSTRTREGENYEVLELYALTNRFVHFLTKKFMLRTIGKVIGSVGFSLIKTSDLCLCPYSDILVNGFISMGNIFVETEAGGKAGSVSIRGTKDQVESYMAAFIDVVENFPKYIEFE